VKQLVLRATTQIHTSQDSMEQQQRQQELAQLVSSSDAWGLIIPFLEHPDVNVQFYGAHIAGVKIVRDRYVFLSRESQTSIVGYHIIMPLTSRCLGD
jgi:hypothetical protein